MRVYVNHIFFCNCGLYLYLLYPLWPYRMLECTLPILGKRSAGFQETRPIWNWYGGNYR
jgi:hypothetical protein